MLNITNCILLLCSLALLASCNLENDADEGKKMFQDYRDFVAEVESDTVVTELDLGNTWKMDTDTLQMLYDRYKNGITEHTDSYSPERSEEVNAFDERLDVAFEQRQKRYDEVSHRYELRKKMLGMEVKEDELSNSINAANMVATYEHFVATLEDNLSEFNTRDWQLVEGWWNALQNRRQTVGAELQPSDQKKIKELEETYQKLRSEALTRKA